MGKRAEPKRAKGAAGDGEARNPRSDALVPAPTVAPGELHEGNGVRRRPAHADVATPSTVSDLHAEIRYLREHADLYDRAPVGLLTLDPAGCVLDTNTTLLKLLAGASRGGLVGWPFELWVLPSHRLRFVSHLYETLRSTTPCACHVTLSVPRQGSLFAAYLESVTVADPFGRRVVRTAVSDARARFEDEATFGRILATERALREQMESERRRMDQVAAASAEMAESLDLETTVHRAATVGTLHLAWYVAIDLCNPEKHVRRAAFARQDGAPDDLPFDPYAPRGSVRVVHTGRAELLPEASPADLLGLAVTRADLEVLREQVGGYLCLPLRAHGRTLGAMSFVAKRGARFSTGDVSLAEEIARHASLAIDNARLYGELQETDRRKDEFLAMLGHELRNPLAAVVTTARNMLRHESVTPEETRRMAEIVERQGARLVRLVDDLLDVSRVTRGKVTLQRRHVSLGDVIARAVESTRPLAEARAHRLLVSSAAESIAVDGDPARLEQVVVNLLANAAKYTPQGGTIEVELGTVGDDAIVRVRDTGAGIPREHLQRIFSPFTQLDTTPDRTDRGLGIGLALARSIVELHGGSIAAHSDGPGHGSEFVVRLPRAPDDEPIPEPAPSGPRATPGPPSQRRRVLVVEDHPDVASALKDELELMGQEVRTAEDGPEALAMAREIEPDLMLIDIGLPGMDGFEVATRVRKDLGLTGAKLVAVTGYGGADVTRQCKAAGFDEHYTKPLSEETLVELIREG